MAINNFKPFAIGAGANVIDQGDYEALAELSSGFTAGKASSAQVNKALRQSTAIASVLAQFIANTTGNDVLDDGNTATVLNNLIAALKSNAALNFLQTANNFSEIKSAGTAAVSSALANLGINANLIPVGVPLPWPIATVPTGWLKCNGASFSPTIYPKLAAAYPSGILPDLRAMFIRGFDDGKGVDASRVLLSSQVATGISPTLGGVASGGLIGIDNADGNGNYHSTYATYNPGTSVGAGVTYLLVRPMNVAFNYIVRGA